MRAVYDTAANASLAAVAGFRKAAAHRLDSRVEQDC